eukprot:7529895-Pyramimonas_sp.AAC.1
MGRPPVICLRVVAFYRLRRREYFQEALGKILQRGYIKTLDSPRRVGTANRTRQVDDPKLSGSAAAAETAAAEEQVRALERQVAALQGAARVAQVAAEGTEALRDKIKSAE